MKASKCIPVALFICLSLLPGCWNAREVRDLAIVMAMGVDQSPDGREYRVSYQIVNPTSIATGLVGGGATNVSPVHVITETGPSLFEASRKAAVKVPRRLFFSHLRIIVIGEEAARKGLAPFYDLLTRSQDIRLTPQLFIARGMTAEVVLRTLGPLERIPANSVRGRLRVLEQTMSEAAKVEIDDGARWIKSPGNEPAIPGVVIEGNREAGLKNSDVEKTEPDARIVLRGIGLFKDGKLKRWLDDAEARGTIWLKDEMKATALVIGCPGGKDEQGVIAMEVYGSNTKIKSEIQNGVPKFRIMIQQEANLKEAYCSFDLSNPKVATDMERRMSERTKADILSALQAARQEKSDIFGLGDQLSRKHPKEWKSMKKDWDDLFAQSDVEVKVESFFRRTEMKTQPFGAPEEMK